MGKLYATNKIVKPAVTEEVGLCVTWRRGNLRVAPYRIRSCRDSPVVTSNR